MKSKNSKLLATRRHLFLENLEGRAMMAGDVTAALVNGVLTVTGDDASNAVMIRQISEKPTTGTTPVIKLAVVGLPYGASPTTINGGTKPFSVGIGDVKGVSIDLGKGDDALGFTNPPPANPTSPPSPFVLPGAVVIVGGDGNDVVGGSIANESSVSINLGAGNDKVCLGNSRLHDISILTDAADDTVGGNDEVYLERTTVGGTASIGTGAGADRVGIKSSAFTGAASIGLGAGNDSLSIGSPPGATPTSFAGGVEIGGGDDHDLIGLLNVGASSLKIACDPTPPADGTVDPPEPDDQLLLDTVKVTGDTSIALGAGADKVGIKGGSEFKGAAGIDLGRGNNGLFIGNPNAIAPAVTVPVTFAGGLNIGSGGNNDLIGLLNVAITGDAHDLTIGTDPVPAAGATTPPPSGNDQVNLENVKVSGSTTIDTGGGNDRVGIKGGSSFTGGVTIGLGDGNDGLMIGALAGLPAVQFGGGLQVSGNGGDDQVSLSNVAVTGKAIVETGDGADKVYLDHVSATDSILASLGAGDDTLGVRGSKAPTATFNGGDGKDLYFAGPENAFTTVTSLNFEPPVKI